MKNLISLSAIMCISIALSPCFVSAKDLVKEGKRNSDAPKKYTIEETTELMQSGSLGKIKLDHDDHVYKCMKIAKEAGDLEGAVDALVEFKTKLGDSLDNEEVNAIIQISNSGTELYKNIGLAAKDIGKRKTTINEHFFILSVIKKNLGNELLHGMQIAAECNYKVDNDYFSDDRLTILTNVGRIKDEARFFAIYEAMKNVGMSSKINTSTLDILYKMYTIDGDVPEKIAFYLKDNRWKSRNQPGKREYEVIRDVMKANYAGYLGQHNVAADDMPVEKKAVVKTKYISNSSKKKVTQKIASNKKINKTPENKTKGRSSTCVCTASNN